MHLQVWEGLFSGEHERHLCTGGRLEAKYFRCKPQAQVTLHNCTTSCAVLSVLSMPSMTLHLHTGGSEFPKYSQGGLLSPYFDASDLEESFIL